MNIKKKYNNHTVTFIQKAVSTNTDALSFPEDTLVIADRQTGGKGRLGRSFVSNIGGVYMSLALDGKKPASFLTTAAAVSAAKAIESLGVEEVKIKWVNDLYLNDKKICGILVNGKAENGKTERVALGVGVNLVKQVDFTGELKQKAGYILNSGDFNNLRNSFIESFLTFFYDIYDNYDRDYILKEYKSRDYLFGKEISFIKENKEQKGIAAGFDNDINLIVNTKKGKKTLFTGEVTINLPPEHT